jgi:hypothetical protein
MGTPRVQVQNPEVVAASGRAGAGALGPLEVLAVAALVAAASFGARRRRG